jgi:hypothetical protein
MQMNRIDRIVGGLGGYNLEMVHLEEFLERTANTMVVFHQQDWRSRGRCHSWFYRPVAATSSK